MWRFAISIIVLVSTIHGQDEVFKNCSRIAFCSALRNRRLDSPSQLSAVIEHTQNSRNVITIPLTNDIDEDEDLNIVLHLLGGNRVRVRVLERSHPRYELNDVLDGSFGIVPFSTVNINNQSLYLSPQDSAHDYTVVVIKGPPFRVEFYFQDQLEVVLNGDRLFVESTEDSQAFTFGVEFIGASKLYGLFHHAWELALAETADGSLDPYRLRNSDSGGYLKSTKAMYGSIPVIYGHSASWTSGIFLHNAAEQWVDISYQDPPSAYFMVESGTLDLYVMMGPTPKEVVRQYTSITGVAHLPQLWALGFHQCRFTYISQEEVKEVVALMDINDFPLDAIWLDDGHSNGNRYFEWNPINFTDPIEMQNNISSTGRVIVSISDPHIKVDDDYPVYTGAKGNYFVKWANGSDFQGNSWPLLSSFIDFLNPQAREYYASWYSYENFKGTTETLAGIWNDMNEPSVFNVQSPTDEENELERTLPFDTVHFGNIPHRDIHNIYGLLHTKATHYGLMQRDNNEKRPFILSRSHFAGSQRYAAIWTGDNTADWPFLPLTYSECLAANLLGLVFCGADVGGFYGSPDDQLLQRWFQAAIWLPFFRSHSNKGTNRREPYLFSEEVQSVLRNALKVRYKHLPTWYTLFYEHTLYGDPLIRPFFYEYPDLLGYDDHLLLGSDILARPVMEANVSEITVTFPGDDTNYWYRVDNDLWMIYAGGSEEYIAVDITTSPLFYKSGSIITRRDIERPSTSYMLNDPYTLYVNLDSNNVAEGRLYVDDYTSFEYQNNDSYLYLRFNYVSGSGSGIQVHQIAGNSTGFNIAIQRIVVHGTFLAGTREATSAIYTTTKDGIPLYSIDIVEQLNRRSGNVILPL